MLRLRAVDRCQTPSLVGFARLVLNRSDQRETVEDVSDIGVTRTRQLFIDRESTPIKVLRVFVLALLPMQIGQVAESGGNAGMTGSEGLFLDGERPKSFSVVATLGCRVPSAFWRMASVRMYRLVASASFPSSWYKSAKLLRMMAMTIIQGEGVSRVFAAKMALGLRPPVPVLP